MVVTKAGEEHLQKLLDERRAALVEAREEMREATSHRITDVDVGWWATHASYRRGYGDQDHLGGMVIELGLTEAGDRSVLVVDTKPTGSGALRIIAPVFHRWPVGELDPVRTMPYGSGQRHRMAKLLAGCLYSTHRTPWAFVGDDSDEVLLMAIAVLTDPERPK